MLTGNIIWLYGYVFEWYSWLWRLNLTFLFYFVSCLLKVILFMLKWIELFSFYIIVYEGLVIINDLFGNIWRRYSWSFFEHHIIWVHFRCFNLPNMLLWCHSKRLGPLHLRCLYEVGIGRLSYTVLNFRYRQGLILPVDKRAIFLSLFGREKFFHLAHQHGIGHNIFHITE